MSIDWILELERAIDNGKVMFACPGLSRNQWVISRSIDDLKKVAKRAADTKKMPVNIVQLVAKQDAVAGDLFLVPTSIGDPGPRGEPVVQWSTVETREAADMMRDVKHGPSPFFAMQVQQTVEPDAQG
ncbi:MAG: hypothetical protein RL417_515 [Pseudomonadota bacterium]|jgi:hypothetical protein